MTTFQLMAKSFRQECKDLVSISKKDRDEKGNLISCEDIAKSKDFKTAYRKAKASFNELVKMGKEGDRIAHLIYYQEARKHFSFQMVEKLYKKHLDAEDGGILFDESKYYDYRTNKNIKESVKAEKKASLKKVKSNKVIKTDHRKKAVIAVIALIAAIAFIVAAYKKGVKPVIKAIMYVITLLATIFVFSKAKRKVLDRIHNKFYGK